MAETLYPDRVVSIYDADTFRVDFGEIHPVFGKSIPVRAKGFDAPEIRGKCPEEKELALKARQITVDMAKGRVELRNIERGKYFRLLADVYFDGESLTQRQLKSGISRPYEGGKREGWCGATMNFQSNG